VEQLIKISKKKNQNSRAYSLFLKKKNLKNGMVFRAKVEIFFVLPKFDWKKKSKNSKRKWFRRVETILKCSRRLIFDHLLAVNSCGQ
jgi:hypothetical protein